MKTKITSVLFLVAVCGVSLVSCSPDAEVAAPLFANTDRIEIDTATLVRSAGPLKYTLPNGHCKNIVIGLFSGGPSVDINNQLTTDILWGTSSGNTGFVTNAQPWNKLYKYDLAAGAFDENIPFDLTANTGSFTMVIWAYDEGYTLIASSPIVTTTN